MSHVDGVLLWLNKSKEGGGKRVYPWALLRGITLPAPDRDRDRSILSPINLSSSGFIYFILFFSILLFTQVVFPSTSLPFSLCTARCKCVLLLWKLKRRDNEGPETANLSFIVFRLSALSLTVSIYCTIMV